MARDGEHRLSNDLLCRDHLLLRTWLALLVLVLHLPSLSQALSLTTVSGMFRAGRLHVLVITLGRLLGVVGLGCFIRHGVLGHILGATGLLSTGRLHVFLAALGGFLGVLRSLLAYLVPSFSYVS